VKREKSKTLLLSSVSVVNELREKQHWPIKKKRLHQYQPPIKDGYWRIFTGC